MIELMVRVKQRELIERSRLTADSGNELKQLWIADRILRIAEIQDTVEQINDQIEEIRGDPENPFDPETQPVSYSKWDEWKTKEWKPGRIPAMLIREKLNALRLAAEELGQLPRTAEEQSDPTNYSVAGITDEELGALR